MKSVHFKRQGADIRVLPEESKKQKRRQWDRIIYFIVLFAIIYAIGYYVFKRVFYVRSQAQVLYENVNIRLLRDSRIMQYYVDEDDTVQFGDTLFRYIENAPDLGTVGVGNADYVAKESPNYSWIVREIINTKEKIGINETKKAQSLSLIKTYQNEIQDIKNSVALGVLPQSRLDLRKTEITSLQSQVKQIDAENEELRKIIKELEARIPKDSPTVATGKVDFRLSKEGKSENKFFVSPFEGSVNRIYVRQFETCLKTEIAMSLHRNSPIFVRAFFDQEDISHLRVGDVFNITFPDGRESTGILRRFYYATIPLPEEFQERYEPMTRTIAGDIYPQDSSAAKLWNNFYKMGVEVYKYKY